MYANVENNVHQGIKESVSNKFSSTVTKNKFLRLKSNEFSSAVCRRDGPSIISYAYLFIYLFVYSFTYCLFIYRHNA